MIFPTSSPSQSQLLTPTRHASTRKQRTRFTFFVGRTKVGPARVASVRRNHSRHRRAPSVSATAIHKRTSAIRAHGELPEPKQLAGDQQAEASTSSPDLDSSPQPTVAMDRSGQSGRRIMNKDTNLPPLPPQPEPTAPPAPEPHKFSGGGGLMKKLTTKLRRPSTSQPNPPAASTHNAPPLPSASEAGPSAPPKKRKTTLKLPSMPSMPAMPKGPSPALPNSFTSPEQRQAALRAMGLIPAVPHPYKDSHGYMVPLSEQEKYLDSRFSVKVDKGDGSGPRESSEEEGESEAKKIREAWLRKNREAEAESPFGSSPQDQSTSPTSDSVQRPQGSQHQPSSSVSSQGTSSSADAYRSQMKNISTSASASASALTATERASALALSDPEQTVKIKPSSQSPRLGTFVEVPESSSITKSSTAVPVEVEQEQEQEQDYHLVRESLSDRDRLLPILDTQHTQDILETTPSIICAPLPPPPRRTRTKVESMESELDPTRIPLPESPSPATEQFIVEEHEEKGLDESKEEEEKEQMVEGDRMLSPTSTSSSVSEKVARWLQSTPTGPSFPLDRPAREEPNSTSVGADNHNPNQTGSEKGSAAAADSGEDSPIDNSLPAIIEVATPTPSTPALSILSTPALSPSSLAPPSPISPLTSPALPNPVDSTNSFLSATPVAPLAIKTDSNNTITPNSVSVSTSKTGAQDAQDVESNAQIQVHEDAAGTPASSTPRARKEKPAPISITATAIAVKTSASAPPTASAVSIPIPITIQSPESSDSPESHESSGPEEPGPLQDQHLLKQDIGSLPKLSISPPAASSPVRGRSLTVSHVHDHKHGAAELSLSSSVSTNASTIDSSRSRSKVPALSPTRTTSSSAASEVPPTPTTAAPSQRGRQASIVSSTSLSSDNHHHLHHQYHGIQVRGNPRIKVQTASNVNVKTDEVSLQVPQQSNVATVIVESPIEDVNVSSPISLVIDDETSAEKAETAVKAKEDIDTPLPAPMPRPRASRFSDESVERRKSLTFGLFGKSTSLNVSGPEKPSKVRSMSNLRKSVVGTISTKFRPKTALVVDTAKLSSSRTPSPSPVRRASPNPTSNSRSPLNSNPLGPTSPTSTYFSARSNGSATSPTGSNGSRGQTLEPVARPRPRQPLSPTIHSRGSILMQTRGLEDDESRRLAEMAFLDF